MEIDSAHTDGRSRFTNLLAASSLLAAPTWARAFAIGAVSLVAPPLAALRVRTLGPRA